MWELCFFSERKSGCHGTHSDAFLAPSYSLAFPLNTEFALESVCHLLLARDDAHFVRDPVSQRPALRGRCLLEGQPREAPRDTLQAASTSSKSPSASSPASFLATLQSPGTTSPQGLPEPPPLGSHISWVILRERVVCSRRQVWA